VTNFSTKYHQKRGGFSPEAKIQTSSKTWTNLSNTCYDLKHNENDWHKI